MNVDDYAADAADLAREIERVADRLRVIGPRLAARASAHAGAGVAPDQPTLRRIREVVQALADLAADAQGRPHRPVPELAPHGLGDQVLVLGHDLLSMADPGAQASGLAVLVDLRRAV